MRLASWPPIPHQQVENNTLLFFFPDTMCRTARGGVLPFRSYEEEHTSVSFSDLDSPGDCFGRPHQAWQQETFHSPSSETAAAPTSEPPSRGVCHYWGLQPLGDGHFVFVNFGPRPILLCADHQPPGPNCGNVCLITYSLTDELLWLARVEIFSICTMLFTTQIPVLCTPCIEKILLKGFKRYK